MLKLVIVLCFLLFLAGCLSQSDSPQVIKLRLFDGNSESNSGKLQIFSPTPSAGWINVCPSGDIEMEEDGLILSVICRSLGFDSDPSDIEANIFRNSLSPGPSITYYGFNCTGDESDLSDCNYDSAGVSTYCFESYNITCPRCENGRVRLSEGMAPYSGFVEVCFNGTWSRICSEDWAYTSSFVTCRQLGYPATRAATSTYFSSNIPQQFSGYVPSNWTFSCYGNESRLVDCSMSQDIYCNNRYISGFTNNVIVQCIGDTPAACTNGSIQLVGGSDMYEGVVQVCINGLWSTMYGSQWDSLDAKVACRQLGLLQPSGKVTVPNSYLPVATGPIYNSPDCIGTEQRLEDCRTSNQYLYSSRSHTYDATVRCHSTSNPVTQCANGDVRLAGGPSSNEGRVELCYNGVWGSVCRSYNNNAAGVICRQLGYFGSNNTIIYTYDQYQPYGQGTGPIHVSEFSCNGYENNLLECSRYNSQVGEHSCSSFEDFALICDTRPAMQCTDGDLRLAAGYGLSEGYPQVCVNGEWISFCHNTWGTQLSERFCQWVFGRTDMVSVFASCCGRSLQRSNTTISIVTCNVQNPSNLSQDCTFTTVPSSRCTPVVLGCYVSETCTEGSIRLHNGTSSTNGIVQVCHDNLWGNIQSYNWNRTAAEVVCRQLSLPWEWANGDITYTYDLNSFNFYKAPFFYTRVSCSGQEASILNCSYYNRYIPSTTGLSRSLREGYSTPAKVYCQDSTSRGASPPCRSGDIRLANSNENGDRLEGRVEICTEGVWATICDDYGWSMNETKTICRQLLGQHSSASYRTFGRDYGVTNLSVVHGLSCSRNSINISQCTVNHQPPHSYSSSCSPYAQLGVVCLRDTVYKVSVATTQTSPYRVGQALNLTCSITPQPSVQFYYQWKTSNENNNYFYFGTNRQYFAVEQLGIKQYQTVFYYCDVIINDYIVSGSIEITMEGPLTPALTSVLPINAMGQRYHFQVTIPENSLGINSLVYNLNWFYNGEKLSNMSDLIISDENTSLMTNLQNGVYEVRYTGLRVLPYDSYCESYIVQFLQRYAAFQSTQFTIGTQENEQEHLLEITSTSSSSRIVTFEEGEDMVFQLKGQIPDGLNQDNVNIKLFQNGVRLHNLMNYTKSSRGRISGFYIVNNASAYDQGIYEAELSWKYSERCNNYRNQIINFIYTNGYYYYYNTDELYEMIIAKSHIRAEYYESLAHSFYANATILSSGSGEVAMLTCSASIAYPQFSTISLAKNNATLTMSTQSPISYTTDMLSNPLGKYECILNASDVIIEEELTIKERADVVLNIQLPMLVNCNDGHLFFACCVVILSSDRPTSNENTVDATTSGNTLGPGPSTTIPSVIARTLSTIDDSTTDSSETNSNPGNTSTGGDMESTSGAESTGAASTTQAEVGDVAQMKQLLPTPYLIGVFVGVFVGGALISAMITSCIFVSIMRSRGKKAGQKKNFPNYDHSISMGFSDLTKEHVNIDEFTYEVMK